MSRRLELSAGGADATKIIVGEHDICGNMVCVPYRNRVSLYELIDDHYS
jgi:hypothetical protein